MKKNVIIMGKGLLAIKISEWFNNHSEYNLLLVVPVIPEPSWTDSLIAWCNNNNISFIGSGQYEEITDAYVDSKKIDLVFSVFYDKIIKNKFIKKCEMILNLHNSPLPKYRGVNPINWALKNEENIHGITIHEITPGIDDGPIISQITYSIYPYFDEVVDVLYRALEYGWVLFEQTMPILYKINSENQDNTKASHYTINDYSMLKERANFTKTKSQK